MQIKKHDKNIEDKSDEELLKVYKHNGDLQVLGELYEPYMHLVYGVCMKYFKNRDEAKDGVMQIFEKLIIEIPRNHIVNFKNWLYVVTKNYCLMQLRSQKSISEKNAEWLAESSVFMENDSFQHPIDSDDETDMALENCIQKLKNEQQQCIRQFYYENKCYNEIAANMKVDEKKVKSFLQNAKRNLKLCLETKHVRQD